MACTPPQFRRLCCVCSYLIFKTDGDVIYVCLISWGCNHLVVITSRQREQFHERNMLSNINFQAWWLSENMTLKAQPVRTRKSYGRWNLNFITFLVASCIKHVSTGNHHSAGEALNTWNYHLVPYAPPGVAPCPRAGNVASSATAFNSDSSQLNTVSMAVCTKLPALRKCCAIAQLMAKPQA